jgi:pimeloyl-ACP methyl ester carboxylesterase
VILLQHGISQDAKAWVSQNNDSIAFLLWKSNYDIWLSNSRGTFYSQNHVSYKSSSEEFWNFTFHEKGYYDNKAVIEYIKTITKVSKIVYVGHSGGTTSSFVYASTRPEEAADSLKLIVALAPVTFLKYYKTPLIETLFRSVQFLVVKKNRRRYNTLFKNYTFRKITYTSSSEFTVSFTTTVYCSSRFVSSTATLFLKKLLFIYRRYSLGGLHTNLIL